MADITNLQDLPTGDKKSGEQHTDSSRWSIAACNNSYSSFVACI